MSALRSLEIRPQPAHDDGRRGASAEREAKRLEALERLDILDTAPEEAFDRITRLARKMFDVPVALVSFLDGHRQWFKAGSEGELPRPETFCNVVLSSGSKLVVPDAANDPRFAELPAVAGESGVRFYAGVPVRSPDGQPVGTLCIVDTRPREFPERDVELLGDLARIAASELELREVAGTDSLTAALSRRAFKEELARAVSLALRHHHPLSVIAIDLDHFKTVNDTFGHAGGDALLREAGKALRAELRATDRLGRIGGEEFAAILPHTSLDGALDVAERMRKAIAALSIETAAGAIAVTSSFGIGALDTQTRDAEAVLAHADMALYEAKNSGRNRVVVRRDPAPAEDPSQGRRVLKAGRIVFNGRNSSVDCTVRRLSDSGATLDVAGSLGVPPDFQLVIPFDRFERTCRVVTKTEKRVVVKFA